MRATRYILEAFVREGIDHVFFVPGGLIDPFLPDLSSGMGITPIVAAHEGGAVYMADGYARARGPFGVCFSIGGPGITNMVTGVAAAYTDSSPIAVISGEVPTDWEGRGGFQDSSPVSFNDVDIFKSVTLSSLIVENPHLVHTHLKLSLTAMCTAPQGPVHLSIPTDVQRSEVGAPWAGLDGSVYETRTADLGAVEKVLDTLAPDGSNAMPSRIIILAGAGVEKSGAARELVSFAERFEIPVATTLRAKGVFPEDHRLSLGVFGYAGHRHAIEAILSDEVEVLLVLGSGLNQRDTLFWNKKMLPSRALVQVDINPKAIGRTWRVNVPVVGDVRTVLRDMERFGSNHLSRLESTRALRTVWIGKIRASGPRYYDPENGQSDAVPLHPTRVITELRKAMPRNTVLVVDSGAHRAFSGHYWEAYEPRSYLSATNLGPMGWAIAAGIGAKAARPERPLVVVTGDGCMLMHGMEIQTAARYNIPVIFLVINNSALGNVWLRANEEGPGPRGLAELPVHDWAGFARSLGLAAATIEKPDRMEAAFAQALESRSPYLIDVRCDRAFPTPVAPFSIAKKEWIDND